MRSIFFCSVLAAGLIVLSPSCFSSATVNNNSLVFQVIQSQIIFDSSNTETATVIKQENNRYAVQIKLKLSAADEFKRITKAGIGKMATMIFNEKVIAVSTIQSELGDNFLVVGVSKNEAEKIASSLKNHG